MPSIDYNIIVKKCFPNCITLSAKQEIDSRA